MINLTKYVQDALHIENATTNYWGKLKGAKWHTQAHRLADPILLNINSPWMIYKFSTIPIKIPESL